MSAQTAADQPDADMLEALFKSEIETLRHRAFETQNMLYAWFAIELCIRRKAPLPDWITECLQHWAVNIRMIASGIDISKPLTRHESETPAEYAQRWMNRWKAREIGAADAAKLLPLALGLGGEGKGRPSAFERMAADDAHLADLHVFEAAPDQEAAAVRIQARRNVERRQLHARLKRADKLR